ncbi:hypothetical protein ACGFSG_16570 [Streptomyces sp. NPDC048512]|uniref:hypothetical protein n=1 Tax=Streptomyces sp. NPDC048512 TaxID=3365563 RepID=UPI00371F79CD
MQADATFWDSLVFVEIDDVDVEAIAETADMFGRIRWSAPTLPPGAPHRRR